MCPYLQYVQANMSDYNDSSHLTHPEYTPEVPAQPPGSGVDGRYLPDGRALLPLDYWQGKPLQRKKRYLAPVPAVPLQAVDAHRALDTACLQRRPTTYFRYLPRPVAQAHTYSTCSALNSSIPLRSSHVIVLVQMTK